MRTSRSAACPAKDRLVAQSGPNIADRWSAGRKEKETGMSSPREKSTLASGSARSRRATQPKFEQLQGLPETPEELFSSLALPISVTIHQPDPEGNLSPQKQDYVLPWKGY